MGLTDPELDLLLEVVGDDPGDAVYLQVGEELVRRSRWVEAVKLLLGGIAAKPQPRAWELLGRAHLEAGDPAAALAAVGHAPRGSGSEAARVELLALERTGRVAEARKRAAAILAADPGDVVAQSLIERLDEPPPPGPVRSPDPGLTVERAERYAVIGRMDRAVRLYRRLVHHNPGHAPLLARLRELAHDHPLLDENTRDFTTDSAPATALAPLVVIPRLGPDEGLAPRPPRSPDDEETDNGVTSATVPILPRRRRRSLLNP